MGVTHSRLPEFEEFDSIDIIRNSNVDTVENPLRKQRNSKASSVADNDDTSTVLTSESSSERSVQIQANYHKIRFASLKLINQHHYFYYFIYLFFILMML